MENTKEFIGDLLIDSGENLLDAFSNNELVKQIPCIKGLIALGKDVSSNIQFLDFTYPLVSTMTTKSQLATFPMKSYISSFA